MRRLIIILLPVALFLSGCGNGSDGSDGKDGQSSSSGTISASSAKSVDVDIQNVKIDSPPVVTFKAADASGLSIVGLTNDHVRFNIAKLVPGSMGDPSAWQNYINIMASGELQGTTENNGLLEDLGNGRYRYTFATDITDASKTVGNISYDPSLTHRVAMQISGFPASNPTYDFRPDGGKVSVRREIVKTENCNSCHNKLALHGGGRVETKYCVTCHNPGSTDPDSGNTVDFKVMVHKIHRGEELPSVAFGPDLIEGTADDGTGIYQIVGFRNSVHDFSTVVFPQDIRNCTKCHDGADADTPQGDNWKTALSMQACGSCHDNIDFSKDGSAAGANDPLGHPGGIVTDNSECVTCHASGRIAGSVEERHRNPVKAYEPKFKFNILEVCGTPVPKAAADPAPNCAGMPVTPTVTFSVSDPTGGGHGYGSNYDIVNDPEFGAGASLNIISGWDSSDYSNNDGKGNRPARANSVSLATLKATATDNMDGSFTVSIDALPLSVVSGSAAVAMEGHPRGESVVGSGIFNISIPVRGEVAYFGINGDPMVARRVAVDISGRCDNCHDKLSLHGANRADNAQLCVICHNPRNTDVLNRPKDADGLPSGAAPDGKFEESIDFKRLIHGIHAAQRDNPATPAVEGHGFREHGLGIQGRNASSFDNFGHVRFPGILSDCTTCHNEGTYELDGLWETPLQNGILATTVRAAPNPIGVADFATQIADQSDDLYTTPTAAVCSACHDGNLARAHMKTIGGALFEVDQATIDTSFESCSVCHGPGKIADLNLVHGIE